MRPAILRPMAAQSSFDIVSEVDVQEVRNAVDQAAREIAPAVRLQEHRHDGRAGGRGDRARAPAPRTG